MYFINTKLKRLTKSIKNKGGRGSVGSIIVRHKKNLIKRKLLLIDRLRTGILYPARVKNFSKLYFHK